MTTLAEPEWRARAAAHEARADALPAAHRARRAGGEAHPVEASVITMLPMARRGPTAPAVPAD